MSIHNPPELQKETRQFASYIAMVVRNAMEDFHCQHLNDDQMKQLNPIIRNAICTALHAFNHCERHPEAQRFADYHFRMIPKYWEPPELLSGYVAMWNSGGIASHQEK